MSAKHWLMAAVGLLALGAMSTCVSNDARIPGSREASGVGTGGDMGKPEFEWCAPEVQDAIRQHVAIANRCFAGTVSGGYTELVASSQVVYGVLRCLDDTGRAWENAQAAAQAALSDVPPPSCDLALNVQGGLLAEHEELVRAIEACTGQRIQVIDDCGMIRAYPSATLCLDDVGRVIEVEVDSEPHSGSCGCDAADALADGGDGASQADGIDAGAAGSAGAEITACITSRLAGSSFPCHAGARLYGIVNPGSGGSRAFSSTSSGAGIGGSAGQRTGGTGSN
jgi:hypothetical protein